jgi:hypothetical protein
MRFLENRILVPHAPKRRTKWAESRVRCGNILRGTCGGLFAEELLLVPAELGTRTKRGFAHSHSDYGDGIRFGRKANPAKIVDSCQIPIQNQSRIR